MPEPRPKLQRNLRAEGAAAEDLAADYLVSLGFTIVTRRFSRKGGEIDLIALDGDELVFVEVKARGPDQGLPEESIGPKKLAALKRTIETYRREVAETDRPYRIDLVAIDGNGLRHHPRIDEV
jgi:putative endonuclease